MFPPLPRCHAFLYIFPALVFYISLLYISVLFTSIYIFILRGYIIISLRGNVATVAMGFQKVLLFEKTFLIFGRILVQHIQVRVENHYNYTIGLQFFYIRSENGLFTIF